MTGTKKQDGKKPNVLLVTKGHPFERNEFFSLFDALDINWTHVEHPAARVFFSPELARDYDAFVMYDMPGIRFRRGDPEYETPDESYKSNLLALLEAGKGMVFLHHAIAGWPAWEEYAEILGGRFLYLPGEVRGKQVPDSGYRMDTQHHLRVLEEHPVTEGLPARFSMTDELYLSEVFEDSIVPLLASDYEFTRDNFYSAAKAASTMTMNENEGWYHENGSNLVGWVKSYRNSPIAYFQGGHGPENYVDENFRQLVQNAICWAASAEALQWAQAEAE